jgi:hypothetical protein
MISSRGKVITVPLPPRKATTRGLLDGDLYAIMRGNVATRYNQHGKKTGIAVRFSGPIVTPWEHGSTVAECRAEYQRKRDLALATAAKARESAREQRRLRLAAKLCRKMPVTINHCRQVGYCAPGINAFRERHGITTDTVPAAVLQRILPSDYRLMPVLMQAAREAFAARV